MSRKIIREAFKDIFGSLGVVKSGHFELNNGKHSGAYIDKETLYNYPTLFSIFCNCLVDYFLSDSYPNEFDVVLGPKSGGAFLAIELAIEYEAYCGYGELDILEIDPKNDGADQELTAEELVISITNAVSESPILAIFAQKDPNGRYYLRGSDKMLLQDKCVLIVDDVFTSGDTVRQVIELARESGAEIAGIFVVWDRSGGKLEALGGELGIYTTAFEVLHFTEWDIKDCPLCANGVSINTELGRGGKK
ncbi:MAG: hypothetical protein A2932_01940 [Candidatus Spechtbacteria bacterium RIFCSPLOWO2_01_FULL_46_10]|uniref:Phosphoribosyltransferase domain-containing protein n=1 Tax=Candidatus Spechtbacteria bacterium RIFCSPLOWO2_01_FULL_46_10 TaxID=1802163 RepID=A0A1G2HHJ0_9BACT|nr:MAG: hypothetical protein A2932_01940 [Candidatus Spechtbacteria bacterium RIFCSPLOWO2_01_FULL_46_10]